MAGGDKSGRKSGKRPEDDIPRARRVRATIPVNLRGKVRSSDGGGSSAGLSTGGFHLRVKTISRSAGRSATAAIAYRSGQRIECEREGVVHDYLRKQGVEHTEIIVPTAASWARDRSTLWNAAEAAEVRRNATVAREYEIAIPHELSARGRVEAIRAFSQELVDRYGVAADFAIHAPHREGDQRNWHAHVMTTTRVVGEDGLGAKTRILDDIRTGREQVRELRAVWGEIANRFLEREGFVTRMDHRSFSSIRSDHLEQAKAAEKQGDDEAAIRHRLTADAFDRAPQVHVGVAATAMERKAAQTEGRAYRPVTELGFLRAAAQSAAIEREEAVAEVRAAALGVQRQAREIAQAGRPEQGGETGQSIGGPKAKITPPARETAPALRLKPRIRNPTIPDASPEAAKSGEEIAARPSLRDRMAEIMWARAIGEDELMGIREQTPTSEGHRMTMRERIALKMAEREAEKARTTQEQAQKPETAVSTDQPPPVSQNQAEAPPKDAPQSKLSEDDGPEVEKHRSFRQQ